VLYTPSDRRKCSHRSLTKQRNRLLPLVAGLLEAGLVKRPLCVTTNPSAGLPCNKVNSSQQRQPGTGSIVLGSALSG
jgi:hypothetical protein